MVLATTQTLHCLPTCSNVRIWIRRPKTSGSKSGLTECVCRFANTWIRAAGCIDPPQHHKAIKNGTPGALQRSENELISLAMPPPLHWQRRQWRQQWDEAKKSNSWCYLILYRHATENGESTDIQSASQTFWNNHCKNIGSMLWAGLKHLLSYLKLYIWKKTIVGSKVNLHQSIVIPQCSNHKTGSQLW